jgi:trigger factor
VTQLVAGDLAGKDADVAVTVRSVKEKQLPELDDAFAQMASEFDTLDELRDDVRVRIERVKRIEQLYAARDKVLADLVVAADVPAPDGVVREEVESRREAMSDELERMGASMADYLAAEDKTEDAITAELTDAATEGIKIQLLLDTIADAEDIQVNDDEYTHEIVHRAQRVGMAPQAYYDQLVRAGGAAAVFGDVRRGKALEHVMNKVKIADQSGNVLTLDALRAASDDETHDHDHEGHDHECHDHEGHDHEGHQH